MFARNQNVKLVNTITQGDAKIMWKMYHDSIMLILVISDDDSIDIHAVNLLDLIFNVLVFHVGIDGVIAAQNIEKLKRDLREYLDAFVEAVNSEFSFLLVMGKIAVASERWWQLSSTELVLLSLLVHSQPEGSSRDIPVFLPQGNPKVPHRLMTFQIVEGVEICVICYLKPTLQEIEQKLLRNYWNPAIDIVKQCLRSHPRNMTPNMSLDNGVFGFILVNTEERKCLCSVYPGGVHSVNNQANQGLTRSRRKSLLTSFYKSVLGTLFPSPLNKEDLPEYDDLGTSHDAVETYQCAADHKTYAIRNETHQLFVLFSSEVPTYALRMLTQETLHLLTKDHLV